MEEEVRWNILIENELWKILEFSKNLQEREEEISEFCKNYDIPIDFAKNKIEKMENRKKEKQQEENER